MPIAAWRLLAARLAVVEVAPFAKLLAVVPAAVAERPWQVPQRHKVRRQAAAAVQP